MEPIERQFKGEIIARFTEQGWFPAETTVIKMGEIWSTEDPILASCVRNFDNFARKLIEKKLS